MLTQMYSRYDSGMLELELADWKFSRKFRLMAFDAGLFSFRDIDLYIHPHPNVVKNTLFTLITNPKSIQAKTLNRREPFNRIKHSTHIRLLIFSKHKIKTCMIYLNDKYVGEAEQQNDSNLYTLKWNPSVYSTGLHKIKTIVTDNLGNVDSTEYEFSLEKDFFKSFGLFASFVLLGDQAKFVIFFKFF